MLENIFKRAVLGALGGFAVMLVVGWTSMYLEINPPEPQATQYATYLFFGASIAVAVLGLSAAKLAFLTIPIFMICAGAVITWQEWIIISNQPDLNGDGLFTIRDFLRGALDIITATGKWYSFEIFGKISNESNFVQFFEIPTSWATWISRTILTAFYWFMAITWIPMIIHFEPKYE